MKEMVRVTTHHNNFEVKGSKIKVKKSQSYMRNLEVAGSAAYRVDIRGRTVACFGDQVVTSAKAVMRSGQFVCHCVVCTQNHAKRYSWIYIKFLSKVDLGPVSW